MIPFDEFVENDVFTIITGKDNMGLQHIALKADDKPLCGTRIKHTQRWELF